jgi:hypothetical protein
MGSWTNPNVQQVTPLSVAGSLSGSPNAATIPPGGSYVPINLIDVSLFTSYDIDAYCYASPAGAVGAPIVALIQLQWFDDLISGIPVFEEDWWIWVGRAQLSGAPTLGGTGPMHGKYMTLTVSIPNATSSLIVQYMNVFGSPRTVPYSDWRQNLVTILPESSGITLLPSTSGSGFDNVLAYVQGATLTAGAVIFIPIALYAGPVYMSINFSQVPNNTLVIATMDDLTSGQIVAGTGMPGILLTDGSAAGAFQFSNLILPRAPCALIMHANATTGGTITFTCIAQQAA